MSTMYLKAFAWLAVGLFIIVTNYDKINKRNLELWGNIVATFSVAFQLVAIILTLKTL